MEYNTDHREETANAKLVILIIVLSFLFFSIGCKSSKPTYKAVNSINGCEMVINK